LKTRRPAEASPAAGMLSGAADAALAAGGGALEAGGAGDGPVVALGGEGSFAAMWWWSCCEGTAAGDGAAALAGGAGAGLPWSAAGRESAVLDRAGCFALTPCGGVITDEAATGLSRSRP